jgi:ElaB/YqjD/DUF883 family membrane-anchored ribosome-binding protein
MSVKNAIDPVFDRFDRTVDSARDTVRNAGKTYEKGVHAAPELARTAQKAFADGVDQLRHQSRDATDQAGEQLDTARLYMVERVQERPFTATLAALGAGFVLGLLFAGNRRQS